MGKNSKRFSEIHDDLFKRHGKNNLIFISKYLQAIKEAIQKSFTEAQPDKLSKIQENWKLIHSCQVSISKSIEKLDLDQPKEDSTNATTSPNTPLSLIHI